MERARALCGGRLPIGEIAIACALGYLDFRYADEDWRKGHLHIANWHASFAARPSVRDTNGSLMKSPRAALSRWAVK